jgi:hypothetical protein
MANDPLSPNAGGAQPLSNPNPGARQYAEPKFIPLLPDQLTDGEKNNYDTEASVLQPIPPPRPGASLIMNLSTVLGQHAITDIVNSGMLVFHSVGDTGVDKRNRVVDEDDVIAMATDDLSGNQPASFFYHLGDVVYEFGQPEDYYSEFYEPFSAYNAPIFAIPGNHDGMIWDASMTSLEAFLNNFCTPGPQISPNAGGLHRSTMDQPGVYFTLEAPFTSIIGLYSNVSDKGPGFISSENGKNTLTDDQKTFLIAELKRLKPIRENNQTAIILAVHHPPYTGIVPATGKDVENNMDNDLVDAFNQGGIWPDVVLSGHAHYYERFERNVNGRQIPYIIAGCGGYNLSGFAKASDPATKVPAEMAGNTALKAYVKSFGYLKIKVTKDKLAVVFNCIDAKYGNAYDSIVIDLLTHQVQEFAKGDEPLTAQ